jgi:hypothetical protein
MKWLYLSFLFVLFFTGCSTTYNIQHFSSKDEYYQNINNSIKSLDIQLNLTDGNKINILGGEIKGDTLFSSSNTYPVSKIKTISYSSGWKSAAFGIVFGGLGGLITIGGATGGATNGSLIGIALGGLAGWFINWNYIFQLNL